MSNLPGLSPDKTDAERDYLVISNTFLGEKIPPNLSGISG
jgi:hypothetical protein